MFKVSGHGSNNPEVMLISDYAQGEDLTTGYALTGYKESLLREFCNNAQVPYDSLYRTTIIKNPLPHIDSIKRKGKKKVSDIDFAKAYKDLVVPEYLPTILEEIQVLKPNLIIPLGELSFQVLSELESIRKFRGSILKLSPIHRIEKYTKILPILGPYPYLNEDHKQKFITQLDFNKVPQWSNNREIPDDTFRIWIAKSYQELLNFCNRSYPLCAARSIEEGGYLVFDIESYMNVPTCLSFCFDGFESVCIPLLDTSISFEQRVLMAGLVAKVLNSPIPKVNQNIKYDWKTQERWKFRVNNITGDTMLAASVLYCEFPKNLGFLTSIYTDLPYFKDEGRQFDPTKHRQEQFYLYNAKDSLSTHQIFRKQIVETHEQGVNGVYRNLMKLLPIYRRMEDRGIRIDEEVRDKLYAKYSSLYRQHTLVLQRLMNNYDLNPQSSLQMNKLVFEELAYKKIRGVKGSDEESLQMLMCFGGPDRATVSTGKDVLKEIINCRKIHKVIEILELPLYPDRRFRCEFNLAGTETGRTSAGKTTDYYIYQKGKKSGTKNLGHSLQTIGKHGFRIEGELYGTDIRSMYVPSYGFSFVEIDLSGAEARVDRVLSGNFDLSVFDSPGIHKLTGSWLFSCLPSDIKKGSLEYHLSKTFRHAGERNMGANRAFMMAQDEGLGLSLSLKDCKEKLEIFHGYAPEMREVYHKEIEVHIRAERVLICPNGRRRDFFDRVDHHSINEGISFLPQAIVSDQNKFSFIQTFDTCSWAYLLCEAHDAGLSEVPIGREEEFANIYKPNVEKPIDFRNGSLKRDYLLSIPCEVSVGSNWQDMEEIKV